jgi:hypothetical protein
VAFSALEQTMMITLSWWNVVLSSLGLWLLLILLALLSASRQQTAADRRAGKEEDHDDLSP